MYLVSVIDVIQIQLSVFFFEKAKIKLTGYRYYCGFQIRTGQVRRFVNLPSSKFHFEVSKDYIPHASFFLTSGV